MPFKPDAAYLHECFIYNPETGALTWRQRPLHHFKHARSQGTWNTRFAGKNPGCPNRDGHIRILVDSRLFSAHRLIWVMMTGGWPKAIDHKNGDGADNRWKNLREATNQQNQWNRRHDRTLPRGVMPSQRKSGRFMARMTDNGRLVYIGTFDTPEEAHAAWRAAVHEKRGEFFRDQ